MQLATLTYNVQISKIKEPPGFISIINFFCEDIPYDTLIWDKGSLSHLCRSFKLVVSRNVPIRSFCSREGNKEDRKARESDVSPSELA